MNSFTTFLENKILLEDAIGAPPGSPPPMGGMPPPPMGGGMGGGMGGPPMGGNPVPATQKLKAYNVWDVLERILEEK